MRSLQRWTRTASVSLALVDADTVALALVVVVGAAAAGALPHTAYLYREASRMEHAVCVLADNDPRCTVARSHVRAARRRIALAALVTVEAALLAAIILPAESVPWRAVAFLAVFATSKLLIVVDAVQSAHERRSVFRDSQRRRG